MWVTELGPLLAFLGAPVKWSQGSPGNEAAVREGARWGWGCRVGEEDCGPGRWGSRTEQDRLALRLVCF